MTDRHYQWSDADYRSDHWRRTRVEASARSGGLCQFCGLVEGSVGHHLRYQPPAVQDSGLVTWLCVLCNDLVDNLRGWMRDRPSIVAFAEARAVFVAVYPQVRDLLRAAFSDEGRAALVEVGESSVVRVAPIRAGGGAAGPMPDTVQPSTGAPLRP